jgi:hypothetical protein
MTLSITTILYGYNSVGLGVIGTASSDSLILTVVTNRTPTATVETIVGLPSISVFYSTRYFTGTKGITTSRTVSPTSTLTSWIGEPISVPSVFQSIQISGTSSSTQGLTLGFPTTSSSTQGLALGSPTTSSSNSSAFSSTSTIIPAIVVPIVVVAFLAILGAFCLTRRRRRRHAVGNTEIFRTESNAYRKPKLEGTTGKASFESQSKPELAGTPKHRWSRRSRRGAELDGTPKSKRSARNRKTASETTGQSVVYQEKEAVQPTQAALTHIPELPSVRDHQPMIHSTDEIRSAPTNSSQSASANEETNLLRAGLTKSSSPTYSASTELTPQSQAAVDASQINKLKAQERELAEYIEAHETLQKLKNEHVALQERIKAAEERA